MGRRPGTCCRVPCSVSSPSRSFAQSQCIDQASSVRLAWWSLATGPQRARLPARGVRAFEPWGNDSPWAGALARAAECHVVGAAHLARAQSQCIDRASSGRLAWWSSATQAHRASKAARVCGVVCLSRGAMTDRGQAPWRVLPSAMQREQPISLVRSLCTSIKHRVCGRLACAGHRRNAHKPARLLACGV